MPDAGRPVRFALAGVRHFHIFDLVEALVARDEAELVAAAEDDADAAAAAHARGVEFTHRSVAELLAEPEKFDVLAVGDYYARRGGLAIRALEMGRHVLLDKPICVDLAELDRIAALSSGAGTPVVGCMLGNRGNGNLRQLRALLDDGAIGTVHTVTFLAQHPLSYGQRPGWYFEPGKHGGTINDIAIHAFDILPWLLGRTPRRLLAARCWNERLPQHPHFQVAAQVMLELDGGVGVLGDLSYLGPDGQGYRVPQYWRFTIHGDGGLAETAVHDNAVRLWRGGAESGELFAPLAAEPDFYLDEFLTEIAGGAPPVLSSSDVLRASRWALRSPARRRPPQVRRGPVSQETFDPTAIAAPESVGLCSVRLQRLHDLFRAYVDNGDMAGAATLIARRGRVAHLGTFGMAHREESRAMAADTLFRIASMTKPITSVAVMMLVEEGRALLNDPVARYLAEFSDAKVLERVGDEGAFRLIEPVRPMTVRHLLTHTSGLTYGDAEGNEVMASYYRVANVAGSFGGAETLATAVGRIGRLPLPFHPGQNWSYGFSTDVLGRLVEVVSGVDLAEFFQTRIFQPLGMDDTHFSLPPDKVGRLARVYTRKESGGLEWFPAEYPYDGPSAYLSGGAGLTSSILDYARFLQMMLQRGTLNGERILGPRTVDLMTTNHIGAGVTTHGPGYGFGLGFDVHADPGLSGSPKGVGSYAWGGYWHTGFWVDPGAKLFAIMMAQLVPSDHVDTGEKLPHLVYQALLD